MSHESRLGQTVELRMWQEFLDRGNRDMGAGTLRGLQCKTTEISWYHMWWLEDYDHGKLHWRRDFAVADGARNPVACFKRHVHTVEGLFHHLVQRMPRLLATPDTNSTW
jgi:hypothetical protein